MGKTKIITVTGLKSAAVFTLALLLVLGGLLLLPVQAGAVTQAANNVATLDAALNNTSVDMIEITGDITLTDELQIDRELTIFGSTGTEVIYAPVSRHFKTSQNLTLQEIILDGGGTGGGVEVTNATLKLDKTVVQNCVSTSDASAVTVSNGMLNIENNSQLLYNSGLNGGAVYASGSAVTVKNSELSENEASKHGGAIYTDKTVAIVNAELWWNTAGESGGAVWAAGNVTVSSSLPISAIFAENNAQEHGGAVYTGRNITIGADSDFRENRAGGNGGAVWAGGNVISTGGFFDNNEANKEPTLPDTFGGGAIYTRTGNVDLSADTMVVSNHAQNGGGIFAGAGTVKIVQSVLVANMAERAGGAVYTADSTAVLNITDGYIDSNRAHSGGAIYASADVNISDTEIISNHAVDTNGTSTGMGGFLYTKESAVKVTGDFPIESNKSDGNGGAFCLESGSITIEDSQMCWLNEAQTGGVIYTDSGDVTIKNVLMEENSAYIEGGCIYTVSGTVAIEDSTFNLNIADNMGTNNEENNGGAVYMGEKASLDITGGSVFTNNTALHEGGAIYTENNTNFQNITTADDTEFDGNTANTLQEPSEFAASLSNIGFASVSSASLLTNPHPINNYDIRFGEVELVLDKDNHFAYFVGYTDGTIRPETDITRAETASIFFRLLSQDSRAAIWSKTNSFHDVESGKWYTNAVSTLANGKILNGYKDGTFRPEEKITRAEFATIAVLFESDMTVPATNTFSDISGHWAEKYIKIAAEKGYVSGYKDGTFRPNANITRAEVATMLNNVLNRHVESQADLLPGIVTFPDNIIGEWYYYNIIEATNSHYYDRKADGRNEAWTALRAVPDWALLNKPTASPGDITY